MSQLDFFELPAVLALQEVQKHNPFNSTAHRKAYDDMRKLALELAGVDIGSYDGGEEVAL